MIPGIKTIFQTFSVNEGGNVAGKSEKPSAAPKDSSVVGASGSDPVVEQTKLAGLKAANKAMQDIEVLKSQYDEVNPFYEGRAAVKKDGMWGFIDTQGNEVVKPQYDEVYSFHEGLAAVRHNLGMGYSHWGFIDLGGNVVIELKYNAVQSFRNGFAGVGMRTVLRNTDYLVGFIDKQGREVVQLQYNNGSSIPFRRANGLIEMRGVFF